MNNQYDVTVTVLTYNSDWKKLKATLCSIIEQKNVKFQIIVSDDGSEKPLFEKTISFFEEADFQDYKLISNEKNEGTVCNFYHSISLADADYIKPISPGDLFYSNTVLSEWLSFTLEESADITFCLAVYYGVEAGNVLKVIKQQHSPRNVRLYYKSPSSTYQDRVITNYFLNDGIRGAFILAKKEIFCYYIKLLLHRVIYTEDLFMKLAILDNRRIVFYPQKGVYYEFGDGGISSSGNIVWMKRLARDGIVMDEICLEQWTSRNKKIFSLILERVKWEKKNPEFYRFAKYIMHPKWLYWKLWLVIFGVYSPEVDDTSYLEHCFKK